jgi:MFS family permease
LDERSNILILRKEKQMFSSFAEFFNCVKEARFNFSVIGEAIASLYYDITQNPDISAIWNGIMNAIQGSYQAVMTLFVIGCILVALFGKKIIGILKFLFFLVVGFALGTHLLTPLFPANVQIPGWIMGLVVGIISAVLARFLYLILYTVSIGYGTYILVYNGFQMQSNATYTAGKALACLIVALIVVVAAIIFKKYVEMAGTAMLGGWCASLIFTKCIYNYVALPFLTGIEWLGILIPTLIIAVIGVIVQVKTRRRY